MARNTNSKSPSEDPNCCERCPAWVRSVDHDGKEILVPLRDNQGNPVTRDGQPQYEKGADGRFVTSGACHLFAAKLFGPNDGLTGYPTPKSNWGCFDPAKFAMLDRLAKI